MKVKVISQRGRSVMVEYGNLQRAIVPITDIDKNDEVHPNKLKMGIQYGIEWSKLISLSATPEDLERNLRQMGIWTAEDALNNVPAVLSALQKTYSIDLSAILRIAKKEVK